MTSRTLLRHTARIAIAAALVLPAIAAAQVANVSVRVGTPVAMGANPAAVAFDHVRGKVYVANRDSDTVSVYAGYGTFAKTIPVGHQPSHLAINEATDTVYVANGDGTMTVIDAATDTVRNNQGVNVTGPMSVNTGTNHMFMVRRSAVDEVNVIVGDNYLQTDATRSWAPVALATNLATNRLFVAHQSSGDIVPMNMNGDLVYPTRECPDGNGGLIPDTNPDPPACIRVPGYPVAVAVNPVTNRAYALSSTNEITVIQGPNMTFQTFTPPAAGTPRNPVTIAVDPVRNKIFAVYEQLVVVMDGNTNAMVTAFTPNGSRNVGIGIDIRTGVVLVPGDNTVLNYFVGDGQDGNREATIPPGTTGIAFDGTSAFYLTSPQGLTRIDVSYNGTYAPSPLHLSIRQPSGPVPPNGALTIDAASDLPGIGFQAVYYYIRRHTNQTGDGWHKAIHNADGTWSAPIIDKEPSYGYTAYAIGVTGLETTSINPENVALPVLPAEAESYPFTLQNITGGFPKTFVKPIRRSDANGDGRNDVFWSHSSGAQGVWLMNGLDFNPNVYSAPPPGSSIVGFGDFDGDGKTDLIWQANGTPTHTITLSDGAAFKSQATFSAPGSFSLEHVIAVADFDGDGKADILWGTDWAVSFGNGTSLADTTFFYAPRAADEQREVPIAMGNFYGDGRTEVLFMGGDGQIDMVAFNRSGPSSGGGSVRPPNTGFVPVAIGDFNGDGKDDIVWRGADGTISLWLMNGPTPIDSTTLLQGGSGWEVFAATDLDGDGRADLVWRHSSGAVGGWLMDGLAVRGYRGWLDGGSCWTPVFASEFTGDRKASLLWRCTNGDYGAWTMNGLDIAGARSWGLTGSGWEAYP